jgi:mRNA interferase RelE/StbE
VTYTVTLERTAAKQLARIHPTHAARLWAAITLLAKDPRPPGAIQLKGDCAWRIRVGDYRIIYDIDDDRLVVLVLATGHRREIYRG